MTTTSSATSPETPPETPPATSSETSSAPPGVVSGSALLPTSELGRRDALLRLLPVLSRHRIGVTLTLLTAAASQVTGIAAAATGAWVIGRAVAGADAGALVPGLVVLGALVAAKGLAAWAESWVAHDMAFRVMLDLRVDVFDGLERLAPAWLLGRRSGDVATAALGDVEALEWFYAHTVVQVVVTAVTPLGALAVMAAIDPRLALVLAPFVLALLSVPLWLLRRSDEQGRAVREGLAEVHADAADGVQGLRELVLFGAAGRHARRLDVAGDRLARAQRANASRTGLENGLTEALVAAAMVAVLGYGAALVRDGSLEQASFPVAVILAGFALAPVTTITGGVRNLGLLRATASRVLAVVDTPARVTERPGASEDEPGERPPVRFQDVTFRYAPDGPDALRDVSFTVPGGSTVALVGASGAGKSTCASLLLRFWDPDAGQITVGGVDLRDLTLPRLRRTVAMVPQDAYLFHGTVADNIRMANPHADADQVRRAADAALVTEFTDRLPGGLGTHVGERGVMLSGGQRQRVALARALLRDAPVLVLDEALSNVDTEGEAYLQRALDHARQGRTTIVIAHRLSTITAADSVVVLAGGRVAGHGTHEHLTRTNDTYRRLISRQLPESMDPAR